LPVDYFDSLHKNLDMLQLSSSVLMCCRFI